MTASVAQQVLRESNAAGTVCRDCRVPGAWAITEGGKHLLLNLGEDVAGNQAVHVDGEGRVRTRVVTGERPLLPWEGLFMPHVATCAARRRPTPGAHPTGSRAAVPTGPGLATVHPLYLARARRQTRDRQRS